MTKLLAASAMLALVCILAVRDMPPDLVARNVPLPASFDIAMPAALESPEIPVVHVAVNVRVADGR